MYRAAMHQMIDRLTISRAARVTLWAAVDSGMHSLRIEGTEYRWGQLLITGDERVGVDYSQPFPLTWGPIMATMRGDAVIVKMDSKRIEFIPEKIGRVVYLAMQ